MNLYMISCINYYAFNIYYVLILVSNVLKLIILIILVLCIKYVSSMFEEKLELVFITFNMMNYNILHLISWFYAIRLD